MGDLHLLFWLSLVPFVTAWMGEHPLASAPAALYGLKPDARQAHPPVPLVPEPGARANWPLFVFLAGGFVPLRFYAATVLCGVRGVCL